MASNKRERERHCLNIFYAYFPAQFLLSTSSCSKATSFYYISINFPNPGRVGGNIPLYLIIAILLLSIFKMSPLGMCLKHY